MNRQSGFTLVEAVVVVVIAAILVTIGMPSYLYVTNSYRMSSEANGLLGDLQYAREEAIKEGQNVTVCASTTLTGCSGLGSWQNGWIVYSNPAPGTLNPALTAILRVQRAFTGGNPPDTFVASGGVSAITYNREGFATTAAGFPNTTITLHDKTNNSGWTRCLWVTPVGLASVETHANNLSGTCT